MAASWGAIPLGLLYENVLMFGSSRPGTLSLQVVW